MIQMKAANLADMPRVAHGFFGRNGGVSSGVYESLNCGPGSKDVPEKVAENRARAVAALAGEAPAKLATVYQVHGSQVVALDDVTWGMHDRPTADAMVTTTPNIVLGILTADCAPILLADQEAGVIGAAHAGWQGALVGVTDTVVAEMEKLGAARARIHAAVGPTISQSAYEVGPEFYERFIAQEPATAAFFGKGARSTHWQFDLPAYVEHRLRAAGVENVHVLGACTYAMEDAFFSYRRSTHWSEPDNGRQLSVIMLRE